MRCEVQELRFGPLELGHPVGMRAQPGLLPVTGRVARFLLLAALGQVSRDLAEASQPACLVPQRRDGDARPKARAVLAQPPAFFRVVPLALGHLELPVGFPAAGLFGRVEEREVAADDLVRGVALDPLGAFVPGHDPARRIEHEDRVVDDA